MSWTTVLNSRGFPWIVLPLLWAATYLPNLGARDLRLEEGRRAGPARDMLLTGNWTLPTLYGEPYLSKPPLFFWIGAAVGAVRGEVDELAVRIPSAVSVLIGAWVIYGFAAGQLPRTTRALAALLLISGFVMLDKGTLGEIEAFFCVLVFGALAVWWNGYAAATAAGPHVPQSTASWLWSGVLLGLAMLTKGPPALVLFYIPVAGFLIRQGQWRRLFCWPHLPAVLIAVAPLGVWLMALRGELEARSGGGVTFLDALAWWRRQLGFEAVAGRDGTGAVTYARHLLDFSWDAVRMVLPWGLCAAVLWPALARRLGIDDGLRRFLTAMTLGLFVFFWLWPISRARHMMVAWYPMCVLAAATFDALPKVGRIGKWPEFCLAGGRFAAAVIAGAGVAGLGLAIGMYPPAIPAAVAALVLCLIAAGVVDRWVVRAGPDVALPSMAAAMAVAILAGWAAISSVFIALYKPSLRDGSGASYRAVHREHPRELDEPPVLYTLLTFPDRGEGHYNRQFYYGPRLKALDSVEELPLNQPSTVLMSRADWEALRNRGQFRTRLLGGDVPAGTPLLVAEVVRLQ